MTAVVCSRRHCRGIKCAWITEQDKGLKEVREPPSRACVTVCDAEHACITGLLIFLEGPFSKTSVL